MDRKNSTSRPTTPSSVAAAGMTSTPGVHSGGLNQCMPQKRPGPFHELGEVVLSAAKKCSRR